MGVSTASAQSATSASAAASSGGRRIRGLDAEQRRAQRREHILAAAFELFARDGYANTAIEQICQTAYVGTKAFYELFDSKEDCYLVLLRQSAARIEERVAQAVLQAADGEPEQQTVRRAVAAFAHTLIDDPRVAVVGFRESVGISPRVEAQRRENRRRAAAFIEAFWRQNWREGTGVDYRALAVATVGGMFESVNDFLNETDPPRTVDDLIDTMTTFVLAVGANAG